MFAIPVRSSSIPHITLNNPCKGDFLGLYIKVLCRQVATKEQLLEAGLGDEGLSFEGWGFIGFRAFRDVEGLCRGV